MEDLIGKVAVCSKGRPGLITGRKSLAWGESWVGIGLDGGSVRWASRKPEVIAGSLQEWIDIGNAILAANEEGDGSGISVLR